MKDKKEIKRATRKKPSKITLWLTLWHWFWNVLIFPIRRSYLRRENWFKKHCKANKCALCDIFGGNCKGCPLDDEGLLCCAEWAAAAVATENGNLQRHHIVAVYRRIKKEYRAIYN